MAGDFDLTITGGQVVTPKKVMPATIAVSEGKIVHIFAAGERPASRAHMDARGLHILPGLIDTHVHIRAPARPDREDFVSGTSAAAAGGITTLLEMPISDPPVNSATVLRQRMTQLESHALIDFGLYGSISPDNMEEIPRMAEAGVIAFKTFLTLPPPGREEEFVGLCCPNVADLYDLMQAVAPTNLLHCFHCEHAGLLALFLQKVQASGATRGIAHARSAPPIVEDLSVAGILVFAELFGNRVQIVHLSSYKAAQLVKEAKAKGVNVSVETCPQYLFLTMEELNRHGPFAKCNPALRTAEEVESLWPYLLDGTIDVIGTDHSPYIPSEKEVGQDDIFRATAGVAFDSWQAGCDAVRQIVQAKLWPANLRILDPVESQRAAGLDGSQALVIVSFESAELTQRHNIDAAVDIARQCGGSVRDEDIRVSDGTGTPTGRGGAVGAWRNAFIGVGNGVETSLGLVADTFETAITWDRWPEFDATIRDAISDALTQEFGSHHSLSCRFTHVYPDGPAPYYTWSGMGAQGSEIQQWQVIKDAANEAVVNAGGTVTHHHAVGRMHRPKGYDRQRPELFAQAVRAVKAQLDPNGILNPGVLIDR